MNFPPSVIVLLKLYLFISFITGHFWLWIHIYYHCAVFILCSLTFFDSLHSITIMDSQEHRDYFNFLESPDECRSWPSHVKSKNDKRNFRQKCDKFVVVNGTLHYKHKKHGHVRVVLDTEKDTILQACHKSPADGGHFGINKTTAKITERYYWPSQYKDIEEYIGK